MSSSSADSADTSTTRKLSPRFFMCCRTFCWLKFYLNQEAAVELKNGTQAIVILGDHRGVLTIKNQCILIFHSSYDKIDIKT